LNGVEASSRFLRWFTPSVLVLLKVVFKLGVLASIGPAVLFFDGLETMGSLTSIAVVTNAIRRGDGVG
jgi:hypothetical protein